MHLTISFEPKEERSQIPIQYNYIVQSAIYQALTKDVGGFFHDVGFELGGRRFKMFTFSRLIGKASVNKEKGTLEFRGPINLVVASPIPQFCASLVTGLLKLGEITLDRAILSVRKVQISEPKVDGNFLNVKVISPVVVYSTMTKYDGSKYTCYFNPKEKDFQLLVEENLRKKYQILAQDNVPRDPPFKITPKGTPKLSILNYKGTIIKGYTCRFSLEGPTSLLQVALDAGLGSKNSQGFGCIVPDNPVPSTDIYL